MLSNSLSKVISVSDICTRTGFAQEDILTELQNKGIAPIHFGSNDYIPLNILTELFEQSSIADSVANTQICSTDIDKCPYPELSLLQHKEKEVERVANATVSFVRKEGRKKPYMVQRRVYFEDGNFKRVSKCFAERNEAEAYAAAINGVREQAVSCTERVHTASAESNREALSLSADYTVTPDTGTEHTQAVGGGMNFYDYMLYYIKYSGKCSCTDRTKKCYTYAAACIREELAKIGAEAVTLEGLSDTMLNRIFNDMAQNICQSTLNKSFNFVKGTLKYAFKKKYISENIADLIDKPKSRIKPEEREPYTDEDIELILGAAKPNTRLYAFINIALYTGMRPAEIRVLKWSDIDRDIGTIHVNGAAKRHYADPERSSYTEYVGETKSKNGIRAIPLAENAAAALRAWRTVSERDPAGKDSEFIFFDENGGFMKEEAYTSMWGRFIKHHGWKGKKYFIYRFRHTFCTRLLLDRRTPQEVQALMGDSTLDVIMRIYNGIKSKDIIEVTRDSVNGIFDIA